MTPTAWILLLWILFIASHLGLASTRVEPVLKRKLPGSGFLAFYSLVAFAIFVPLCWIYFANPAAGSRGGLGIIPVLGRAPKTRPSSSPGRSPTPGPLQIRTRC